MFLASQTCTLLRIKGAVSRDIFVQTWPQDPGKDEFCQWGTSAESSSGETPLEMRARARARKSLISPTPEAAPGPELMRCVHPRSKLFIRGLCLRDQYWAACSSFAHAAGSQWHRSAFAPVWGSWACVSTGPICPRVKPAHCAGETLAVVTVGRALWNNCATSKVMVLALVFTLRRLRLSPLRNRSLHLQKASRSATWMARRGQVVLWRHIRLPAFCHKWSEPTPPWLG